MLNGGSDALAWPSLTLMRISTYSPTDDDDGVPVSRPVDALNDAQAGRLAMANVSVLPSGSEATGVNEYDWPVAADVAGMPEMVGARFVLGCVTVQSPRLRRDLQPSRAA